MSEREFNILIGCTGSVATIKLPKIVKRLQEVDGSLSDVKLNFQVVCTSRSLHFFDPTSLDVVLHKDEHEWANWSKMGDNILHIDLRRWADIFVISPLDANTLAKMATGICDNLLTSIVRAWDVSKPLLFAPAMNTHMWNHPLTSQQVSLLKGFGYKEIPCISKKLACGDEGLGAMADVETIVLEIVSALGLTL